MPKTNKWKTSQGYIYTHTTHTAIITKWQTKGKKKGNNILIIMTI